METVLIVTAYLEENLGDLVSDILLPVLSKMEKELVSARARELDRQTPKK
jgi:hypothetical protein